MITETLASKTGTAFIWRAVQLGGTKVLYTLRTLILSYLLIPEDFGLFAVTIIALEFLMNATDFGLITALIHENDPTEEQFHSVWTLNVLRGAVVSALVLSLAPLISDLFSEPRAASLIMLASFKPLLDTSGSIRITTLTAELKFKQLALIKISEALISSVTAILLASYFGVWALVTGIISGSLISNILSYVYAPYQPRFSLNFSLLKGIISFSKWLYFSVLLSLITGIFLQFIIKEELGLAELGLFFLAIHLAFLPAELIKEIYGSVMFPVFSGLRNNIYKLTAVFRSVQYAIFLLAVPSGIYLVIAAPYLVDLLLSSRYAGTAGLIQIFVIVNIIGLFGETVVPLFTGLGNTRLIFSLEAIQSILLLLSCYSFIHQWGIIGAAAAWIPSIALSQILAGYYLSKVLVKPFSKISYIFISIASASLAGIIIMLILLNSIPGTIGFITASLLGGLAILITQLKMDIYFDIGMRRYLLSAFPKLHRIINNNI